MQVPVNNIKVGDRLRKDTGDLSLLTRSIKQLGLINPIVINENNELLSGYRRLEACKQLGFDKVQVRIIPTGEDNVKELDWEFHENVGREALTDDEAQEYINRRNELLHPEAQGFWAKLKAFFARIFSFLKRK